MGKCSVCGQVREARYLPNGVCALCARKVVGCSKSAINTPTTPLTQANLHAHEEAFDQEMLAPEDSQSMLGGSNNSNLLKKRFAE